MRTRRLGPVVLVALAATALACARRAAPVRPQINYGADSCDYCRMTISEPTWASVALEAGGREARFDDLRCLAGFLSEHEGDWRVWVHTVDADRWIDASTAWFARQPDRVTPMGSGWSAYADRSAAESASGSSPMDWKTFEATAVEQEKRAPAAESGASADEPEHMSSGGDTTHRRGRDDS